VWLTVTLAATEGEAGGRMSRIQRLKDGTTGIDTGSTPSEQRLIRHLLRHYDVDARGVPSVNATIFVTIQLFLLRMQQLVYMTSFDRLLKYTQTQSDHLMLILDTPSIFTEYLTSCGYSNGGYIWRYIPLPVFEKMRMSLRYMIYSLSNLCFF